MVQSIQYTEGVPFVSPGLMQHCLSNLDIMQFSGKQKPSGWEMMDGLPLRSTLFSMNPHQQHQAFQHLLWNRGQLHRLLRDRSNFCSHFSCLRNRERQLCFKSSPQSKACLYPLMEFKRNKWKLFWLTPKGIRHSMNNWGELVILGVAKSMSGHLFSSLLQKIGSIYRSDFQPESHPLEFLHNLNSISRGSIL